KFRRVLFDEYLRLEIEPRRQAEVFVERPGEAIGAAVLAAAVRVDAVRKSDVGTVVAGDDRARRVAIEAGRRRRRLLGRAVRVGVVVDRDETIRRVRSGAAAVDGGLGHRMYSIRLFPNTIQ